MSLLPPLAWRLLGAAGLLALAGCDDDTPALRIYPTIEACQAEHSAADCAAAYIGARHAHDTTAPAYPALDACEQIYGPGQCLPRNDNAGTASFMPIMAGFLIGEAIAGSSSLAYQPVYVNRQGVAYAGTAPIGTYRSECVGAGCPGNTAGYIYASSSGSHGGVWTSGHYAIHSVSRSSGSSSVGMHSSGILRGGFGRIAHAIGHIGG